ncbi:MAG: hypothetical protein ACKO3F_00825 [Cyanobium sp.]
MTLAIRTEQSAVAEVLQQMAALCQFHGASWHPQLEVEELQGSLRLLAPACCSGPLITLPTALLVPIDGARWGAGSRALELLEAPGGITAVQRELLELHIALYNATSKISWWSREHPSRLVEQSAAVAEALVPLKPSWCKHEVSGASVATPAEAFLATRSFGWRKDAASETQCRMLMPLIDLLNHHQRGAPYKLIDQAMVIEAAQVGDRECFAHYGGRRDVLDLALHYGHFDLSTPFAHTAPLEMAVEGVGWIRVEQQGRRPPRNPLDPPRVQLEADGLRLSHLCCHLEHPSRARTVLLLALRGWLQQRGHAAPEAQRLAQRGMEELSAANRQLLDQLARQCEEADHPGGGVLAAAARRQAGIIAEVLR